METKKQKAKKELAKAWNEFDKIYNGMEESFHNSDIYPSYEQLFKISHKLHYAKNDMRDYKTFKKELKDSGMVKNGNKKR